MSKLSKKFEKVANKITQWTGSSWAFGIALGFIVGWALSGPIFGFSDTWQLVINTSTTIITFLMVFLIQKTQNKDSKAIHLKLNELVASSRRASNRLVDIEDLSEEELDILHKYYQIISDRAEEEKDIHESHSIEAAHRLHDYKTKSKSNQEDQ